MTVKELQKRAWATNEAHGFHEDKSITFGTRLMLIVSELSEALEEERKGQPYNRTYYKMEGSLKPDGIPSELADAVIRIADIAEVYGIDLEAAIREKMDYNDTRPYKHGKVF